MRLPRFSFAHHRLALALPFALALALIAAPAAAGPNSDNMRRTFRRSSPAFSIAIRMMMGMAPRAAGPPRSPVNSAPAPAAPLRNA